MRIAIACGLALALAGCQSITPDKVDKTIDATFPIVCAGIDLGWAGFEAYKGSHPDIKPALVVKANAAYFAAKGVCSTPPTNSSEALIAALKAASDFNSAIRTAKNVGVVGGASGPS